MGNGARRAEKPHAQGGDPPAPPRGSPVRGAGAVGCIFWPQLLQNLGASSLETKLQPEHRILPGVLGRLRAENPRRAGPPR